MAKHFAFVLLTFITICLLQMRKLRLGEINLLKLIEPVKWKNGVVKLGLEASRVHGLKYDVMLRRVLNQATWGGDRFTLVSPDYSK